MNILSIDQHPTFIASSTPTTTLCNVFMFVKCKVIIWQNQEVLEERLEDKRFRDLCLLSPFSFLAQKAKTANGGFNAGTTAVL